VILPSDRFGSQGGSCDPSTQNHAGRNSSVVHYSEATTQRYILTRNNLFGKASRSRVRDILAIFRKRYSYGYKLLYEDDLNELLGRLSGLRNELFEEDAQF